MGNETELRRLANPEVVPARVLKFISEGRVVPLREGCSILVYTAVDTTPAPTFELESEGGHLRQYLREMGLAAALIRETIYVINGDHLAKWPPPDGFEFGESTSEGVPISCWRVFRERDECDSGFEFMMAVVDYGFIGGVCPYPSKLEMRFFDPAFDCDYREHMLSALKIATKI
jgi:hypothetical protein